MTPAPLSRVIKVVAEASKYDPVRNRQEIVSIINGCLAMLFRTPATRLNYFNVDGCAISGAYSEQCLTYQPGTFLGVVIPCNISNIREIRSDSTFFEISEARVDNRCLQTARYYDYSNSRRQCQPIAEHLPMRLLEADIPCTSGRVITFRSCNKEDCEKLVGVRYLDMNGREQREDIVLANFPMSTSVSVSTFLDISFPEREGWITVETAEGNLLGRYHPSIFTPQHEWYKLQFGCPGARISYRGIREPMPLVFDTDMVPFSDSTLWRLALKAYDFLDVMTLTSEENAALARIYAQLSAVTSEDLAARNHNFNNLLLPETGKAMLSTGRYFSRA